MTTSFELHYAPKPPLMRRARVRLVFSIASLLSLTCASVLWGEAGWNKVQMLYWQHRCARYTAPPGFTVSTAGPATPNPVEWVRFFEHASWSGFSSHGTVFLHEMISPAGDRRLVAVDLHRGFACAAGDRLVPRVFVQGSAFSRPREIIDLVARNEAPFLAGHATFHYGKADSADRAHFTIEYEMGGSKRTLDGWLTDADRVILEERSTSVASVTP